jgi:glutamate synthase (NADPH/NADH) small chain
MPGRLEERRYAHEEGVQFVFLAIPQEILPGPTGHVQAVRFLHARLGDPDPSGRPRPIPISDSAFELPASAVVIAAGYSVDQSLTASSGITTTLRGTIATSSTGATSRPGVFAAGDCVRGADLVVTALADARQAARAIDAYLAALPASMARRSTTS